jgi:hypothetical protein
LQILIGSCEKETFHDNGAKWLWKTLFDQKSPLTTNVWKSGDNIKVKSYGRTIQLDKLRAFS